MKKQNSGLVKRIIQTHIALTCLRLEYVSRDMHLVFQLDFLTAIHPTINLLTVIIDRNIVLF